MHRLHSRMASQAIVMSARTIASGIQGQGYHKYKSNYTVVIWDVSVLSSRRVTW